MTLDAEQAVQYIISHVNYVRNTTKTLKTWQEDKIYMEFSEVSQ